MRVAWPSGALFVAAVLCLGGCDRASESPPRGAGSPAPLETVDVEPPPDVLVDPETDEVERRRRASVGGILPPGFPQALPLPLESTITGSWGSPDPRVELLVPQPPSRVRPRYLERLAASGWAGEGGRFASEGTEVVVEFEEVGPSTRITIHY